MKETIEVLEEIRKYFGYDEDGDKADNTALIDATSHAIEIIKKYEEQTEELKTAWLTAKVEAEKYEELKLRCEDVEGIKAIVRLEKFERYQDGRYSKGYLCGKVAQAIVKYLKEGKMNCNKCGKELNTGDGFQRDGLCNYCRSVYTNSYTSDNTLKSYEALQAENAMLKSDAKDCEDCEDCSELTRMNKIISKLEEELTALRNLCLDVDGIRCVVAEFTGLDSVRDRLSAKLSKHLIKEEG